jgi:hypothetical protein
MPRDRMGLDRTAITVGGSLQRKLNGDRHDDRHRLTVQERWRVLPLHDRSQRFGIESNGHAGWTSAELTQPVGEITASMMTIPCERASISV